VLFGGTPVTTATLVCFYNGQGSTVIVIVNGSYISDLYGAARSVRETIIQGKYLLIIFANHRLILIQCYSN